MSISTCSEFTTGDVVRTMLRHWKKGFSVFCGVVGLTFAWIVFAPQEYESVAKVYVKVGRENNTLDPTATTGQTVNIEQTLEAEINSTLQIATSRETVKRVVNDIGVDLILAADLDDAENGSGEGVAVSSGESIGTQIKDWVGSVKSALLPSRFDESKESLAIRRLRQKTNILNPKKSSVIEICCRSGHPELAQRIASSWVNAFIAEHLRVTRTEGSLYFFVRQTEDLQLRLLKIEEELSELKTKSRLVTIDGQRKILEQQADAIRTRDLTNSSLLESSQAKVSALEKILEDIPEQVQIDATESVQSYSLLRQKLFELQIREAEQKSRLSETNPDVIAIVNQREAVEAILAQQPTTDSESRTGVNPTFELMHQALLSEQALIASLKAEKQFLGKQREEILKEIEQHNRDAIDIAELERQQLSLEAAYLDSSTRLEQARVLDKMQVANISSITYLQPASYDTQLAGLGRKKTLLLGLFLGLVLGLAFAATAEFLDRSFATPAQVEQALNVPVLVSIDHGRRQFVDAS